MRSYGICLEDVIFQSHMRKSDCDGVYNWPRKRLGGQRYILGKKLTKVPPLSQVLALFQTKSHTRFQTWPLKVELGSR